MDTQKLLHLLAIVEHGTFSEAARAVHLTQPALSRSIRALEHELKAPLFDRGARRARLTVFGELVADRARRMRLEERQLRRDLELLRGGEEGSLTIGVAPAPAALLLTPFLIHMAQAHPRIKVRTETGATSALLDALRRETIDAIVGDAYVLRAADDVDIEPLGELPAGLVCRAGHPILRKRRIDIEAIRAYPVATTTLSTIVSRQLAELWGPGAAPDKLFTLHCDNLDMLRSVTLATDTLLFGVLSITRQERAAGVMAEVPMPPDPRRCGRYGIARMAARSLSPALETLYAFTREHWKELSSAPARQGARR
ncbi:Transcriptional regulator LysR family [Cupriavidus phytorum]|uniref:Transcriptional regulator LysR family n=2 Tax=Cupriavidus TaxID=106589 RepID=A0A975XKH8_9BURK|nr:MULTISPECIES: LysR substrate-binding domain-containing protein [Cupriavidus]PZX23957.1 DNA-binding transcriptional LysR family regulator [Cupriavidus alkaliphilus]SOY75699.1 Transcriptional regulator LysR family [Cupriavidus taiwanensis]